MTAARGGRSRLAELGAVLLGVLLVVWTLAPIYNMILTAVQEKEDVFSSNVWPPNPSLDSFPGRVFRELLAAREFLGPDGQQLLYRCRRCAVNSGHRLAHDIFDLAACKSAAVGC